MKLAYTIFSLSESAITVAFEQVIDEQQNEYIIYTGKQITANPFLGFREIVISYSSLTVYYNLHEVFQAVKASPSVFVSNYLKELISSIEFQKIQAQNNRTIEIPVSYNGEDMEEVMEITGLSKSEIVKLHTAPLYRVFMMGFLPGFAYLGGMDKRLICPRKEIPRTQVPAGSVGIGGVQTGVYPVASAGGWQLIGRTDVSLFTPNEKSITLLQQGDYVKFVSIS